MQKLLFILILSLSLKLFIGCDQTKEKETEISNILMGTEGIAIGLTWSTGTTPTQARAEIDLDFFVETQEGGYVGGGISYTEFEHFVFTPGYPNGTYHVEVRLTERMSGGENKRVNYSLTFYGDREKNYTIEDFFSSTSPNGTLREVAHIIKQGTTYTIVKL